MAGSMTSEYLHHLGLPTPAPVYLRSSPPLINNHDPPFLDIPRPPLIHERPQPVPLTYPGKSSKNTCTHSSPLSIRRKLLPARPRQVGPEPELEPNKLEPYPVPDPILKNDKNNNNLQSGGPHIRISPASLVRIDPPMFVTQASIGAVKDPHDVHEAPVPPIPASARFSLANRMRSESPDATTVFPPQRNSIGPIMQSQQSSPIDDHRAPDSSGSRPVVEPQIETTGTGTGDESMDIPADQRRSSVDHGASSSNEDRVGSSHGSNGSTVTFDDYEPLNYFHKPFRTPKEKKSKPPKDSGTDAGSSNHLAPKPPTAHRPASVYSSTSDYSTSNHRSPRQSPHVRARSSRNSNSSPDTRTRSFVDVLNTPYPQAAPTPAQSGATALLRSSLGGHASLLSQVQTFNMYLANVKKTGDLAVQYEFAVFLVNSLHQMPREELDDGSVSGRPGKDSEVSRTRLLKEAKAILQRLSDRSYPFAQYYLADGYASGLFSHGTPAHNRAFPLFVAASKHGHVEACYRTALCYEFGWGCWTDGAKAEKFYRHAASKKHPGAMLRMSKACLSGDMGLGKRYREGVNWLKRATESADSQYNSGPYELGLLHVTGHGDDVFPDQSYAAQLFTQSADLGHAEASYRMGDAYEHGKLNCPRDPALSIHFYTGAAQLGHQLAMMALCAWYIVGAEPVLERDESEAYEWARKAAETGLPKAQYAVGYFTEAGIGCRRDILEAKFWYGTAADQGDERAKHRIAAILAAADGANPKLVAAGAVVREGQSNGENKNNKLKNNRISRIFKLY